MLEQPCPTCGGKRLKPESLSVLVHGQSIGDVVDLPVSDALAFFESIPLRGNGRAGGGLDPGIARPILKEVNDRSEEHTSELQSQSNLVCRLLLEKKNSHRSTAPPNLVPDDDRRHGCRPAHSRSVYISSAPLREITRRSDHIDCLAPIGHRLCHST